MNKTNHLLVCLAEECAEVTHRVTKALRFGLNDVQPGQARTNAELIMHELMDLLAIVDMLHEHGTLDTTLDHRAIQAKKSRVEEFMIHARNTGALSEQERNGDGC